MGSAVEKDVILDKGVYLISVCSDGSARENSYSRAEHEGLLREVRDSIISLKEQGLSGLLEISDMGNDRLEKIEAQLAHSQILPPEFTTIMVVETLSGENRFRMNPVHDRALEEMAEQRNEGIENNVQPS